MNLTRPLRVRTITTGLELSGLSQLDRIERAIALLRRGRTTFEQRGYEVQTLRIATNAVLATQGPVQRNEALDRLEVLDRLIGESGVLMSIGPVIRADHDDASMADWTCELIRRTRHISFSVVIASRTSGVHREGARSAARIMKALAGALPDGLGNFRFAAAAGIPAGTPFFPVAWHEGGESLALGLESASVVEQAFSSLTDRRGAVEQLQSLMNAALSPVQEIGSEFARSEGLHWLGIDSSPAPLKDRSIAAAVEALTHVPFGSAATLEACSIITAATKSLRVKTCGYSGLMLPVLEDPLLAQRAGEGCYTVRDLLLYSSVCGTGLDVVPIPGETSIDTLHALLTDVAALSVRLGKPLSARLFLVPGKTAGEMARFDDPLLTDCVVMKVD